MERRSKNFRQINVHLRLEPLHWKLPRFWKKNSVKLDEFSPKNSVKSDPSVRETSSLSPRNLQKKNPNPKPILINPNTNEKFRENVNLIVWSTRRSSDSESSFGLKFCKYYIIFFTFYVFLSVLPTFQGSQPLLFHFTFCKYLCLFKQF